MPVLLTIEAQLSLHKRNVMKAAPEARERHETGGYRGNYEQAKVGKIIVLVLKHSVSCK